MTTQLGEQPDARGAQGQQQSQQGQQASAAAGAAGAPGAAPRAEGRPAAPAAAAGERAAGAVAREAGRTGMADAERSIPMSGEGARMQRAEPERARGATARRAGTGGQLLFRGGFPPSPWEVMRRMAEEMTQLIEGVGAAGAVSTAHPGLGTAARLGTGAAALTAGESAAWVPQVDVIRRPDAVVVRADLPGIPPDDIVVTVQDGLLTIAGERQEERKEDGEGLVRNELVYGSFYRAIPLPDGADESRVAAMFRNGVLEITVPIAEREQGRRVRVQS